MKKQTLTALALAACTLGTFVGCGGDGSSATKNRYETGVSLTVNLDTSELTGKMLRWGIDYIISAILLAQNTTKVAYIMCQS